MSNIYLLGTKRRKKENNFLPIKVLQSNDRVAEVQFVCDCCSKIVNTSLIAKNEIEEKANAKISCWHCKNP